MHGQSSHARFHDANLMQGHIGRQRQQFSVELFRQLSKQQALILLQR